MHDLIDTFLPIAGPFVEHLRLTAIALAIALAIAVPVGVLLARVRWLRGPVLSVLGVIYTIPSLSLLVLLIPLFGIGSTPAIIALVAYAQLVLVRNIVVGLTGLDPAVVEAARGMGMSGWQRFYQVELPLALPLILAGVRLATLSIIAIGTVAALVSAGGLGTLLLIGVTIGDTRKIVAGSIAVAVLAFGANAILRALERGAGDPWRGADGRLVRTEDQERRTTVFCLSSSVRRGCSSAFALTLALPLCACSPSRSRGRGSGSMADLSWRLTDRSSHPWLSEGSLGGLRPIGIA